MNHLKVVLLCALLTTTFACRTTQSGSDAKSEDTVQSMTKWSEQTRWGNQPGEIITCKAGMCQNFGGAFQGTFFMDSNALAKNNKVHGDKYFGICETACGGGSSGGNGDGPGDQAVSWAACRDVPGFPRSLLTNIVVAVDKAYADSLATEDWRTELCLVQSAKLDNLISSAQFANWRRRARPASIIIHLAAGGDVGFSAPATFTIPASDRPDLLNDVFLTGALCGPGAKLVGNSCWLVGAAGKSCTDACSIVGMKYSDLTRDFAGSGGSLANCETVKKALSPQISACQNFTQPVVTIGCIIWGNGCYRYLANLPTAADTASSDQSRFCACE